MASLGKDLSYGAEYAKSNRAACKGCHADKVYKLYVNFSRSSPKEISSKKFQNSLRMSFRKPSRFFDGLQDNWFHFTCFWKKIKQNDINEASIRGMELLKWSDQERIRKKIIENQAGVSCVEELSVMLISEYAATGRSKCVNCKENIKKNTLRLGMKSSWYHVNCFEEMRQYALCTEKIVGFQNLSESDQDLLKTMFNKQIKTTMKKKSTEINDAVTKRAKMDRFDTKEKMERLKAQTNEMWSMREKLSKLLNKSDIQTLLQANHQALPKRGGESKLLDRLVDCMVFGCPLPCERCKEGNIVYSSSERSYVCTGYISEYTRCMYTYRNPPRKPFVIPDEMKKSISEFENFEVKVNKNFTLRPEPSKILSQNVDEMSNEFMKHGNANPRDARFGLQRQIVKNGTVVDAECLLQKVVHVWKDENGKLWETTLGMADFQTGANSFYKLQLLKHDVKQKYYLFRSWGRVGTDIGGSKTDKYNGDLEGAKVAFEKLFSEKTANNWNDVENFRKVPGKMSLIETDYRNSKELEAFVGKPGSSSKLPESIQQIIKMIFDVDAMNDILKSLEVIDTNKMPLGMLSIRHIKNAYKILTELQKLMEVDNAKYEDYLDATNRFFTLIPHNFGMNKPPLLNSQKLLIEKTKLLDDLLELEVTYSILKTDNEAYRKQDPVDVHYEKLHAQLEILDKQSDEYKRILQYAANTHAPTHDQYKLEIIDIIRVKREGESERFKKNIPNHYLLWHGSRITNYAGILSQGLRVAPAEAPVTGYMFGKGIYFADLISKSANYCYAINTEGFILLCEVALGEMQEEIDAKSITKPNRGKHSVKGLGQMIPDPSEYFITEDGVTIPMGKPVNTKRRDLTLLYNEYIVYDVAQVEIKYLVRVKFISSLF
uniref:Poly [ADP-ribose] polymerase n=1 Tax=Onchocerca volvulus TaxID=6282 RepID=A0A8R1Y175_ONCVO